VYPHISRRKLQWASLESFSLYFSWDVYEPTIQRASLLGTGYIKYTEARISYERKSGKFDSRLQFRQPLPQNSSHTSHRSGSTRFHRKNGNRCQTCLSQNKIHSRWWEVPTEVDKRFLARHRVLTSVIWAVRIMNSNQARHIFDMLE